MAIKVINATAHGLIQWCLRTTTFLPKSNHVKSKQFAPQYTAVQLNN